MSKPDEQYWGVLVSVSVCDSSGSIFRDLGYLYDKDYISDYDEAVHVYDSLNLTPSQEKELWLYLNKWIKEDEGLYLSYEIIDDIGIVDEFEFVNLTAFSAE